MSLKIWLPLDSDLRNLGCSNVIVTNNGTTVNANGKIGRCYEFGTNKYIKLIDYAADFLTYNEFSLSVWFKCTAQNTSHTGSALISGGNWNQANNLLQFSLGNFSTDHYTKLLISGSGNWGNGYSYNFYLNTWYNVVLTSGNGKMRAYVNGQLIGDTYNAFKPASLEQTWICIGNGTYAQLFHFIGLMNDVRIYDHCLSAAEVHEIAQGLVLHYKLDGPMGGSGINLLRGSNQIGGSGIYGWINNGGSSNFSIEKIDNNTLHFKGTPNNNKSIPSITTNIVAPCEWGKTYTYQMELKFDKDIKLGNNVPMHDWPGARQNNVITETSINGHANGYSISYVQGYGGVTLPANTWQKIISKITFPASPPDASYPYPAIRAFVYGSVLLENTNTEVNVWMRNCKIEEGTIATPWTPTPSEMGIDTTIIEDSSGYNHNGTTLNTVQVSSDSPRYNVSTNLVNANSMINCGRGGMVTDSITVNFWVKSSAWGNPISCTEGGGWNFEATGDYFRFPVYISGVGYKYGQTTHTRAQVCNNQWHMLTGVYDRLNQKVKVYVDGELDNEISTGSSNNIGYNGSNVIWIGAEATGSSTTALNGMAGLFSDFRIYCTPLLDTDIKQLYNIGMKVDKNQNVHVFELEENQQNKLYKTGILTMPNFYENDYKNILQYDQAIYTEPDGSAWAHVFHHNNPANARFTNGAGDWSEGVYLDADRWYDVEKILDNLVQYEFLVKQKTTDTATETKWRWIQNINPLNATWETVGTDACMYNTSSGYSVSNYKKGMYIFKTSNLHMCIANNSKGNWYGGIGACSVYQNGIPGYPNTTVTTGYIDLYVRIYPNTSILKDFGFSANQFIEM